MSPGEDHARTRASRRKACDLCFTKKIKCDMIQPACSNCVLYKSECRTTIIRRKGNGHKWRSQATEHAQPSSQIESGSGSTEERLARMERHLQQIINTTIATGGKLSSTTTSPKDDDDMGSPLTTETSSDAAVNDDEQVLRRQNSPPEELPLSTIEEVIPIVDHYFSVFNPIVPLFDHKSFMALLNGWYGHNPRRSTAAWAAIQVVLALSLRTPSLDALVDSVAPNRFHRANLCLKNAQSVVSDLVARDEDLLGIQVLLGIVLLFQNSSDPKPASVVIGTAMRLAHRLRLHSQEAARYFSPEENEQRSRVFWIAYTLDKDISLRIMAPSVQSDIDIDVPLPSLKASDGVGLIWTQDGRSKVNFHRLRVDLGHIEGQVYDFLYSNRSSKIPKEERQRRVRRLQGQLDRWYQRVPAAFQIEHVASTLDPGELAMVTKMHYAYLLATIMTHGLYGHSAEWIRRVSSPGREEIRDLAKSMDSCATTASAKSQSPPFPGGWSRCVEISRGCMKLFEKSTPTECLVWQCCCPHLSGLTILLANMLINPSHEFVTLDQLLATKAMQLYDKILDAVPSESFRKIRIVVGDLYERAFEAVKKATVQDGTDGDDILDSFDVDPYAAAHDGAWIFDSERGGEFLPELVTNPKTNYVGSTFNNAFLWDSMPPVTTEWSPVYDYVGSGAP
ncbi:putative transcriptional regulatory protein [Tolypocladium ophioglossoides CBS 100239]|uniref:Putative transcriptional regulatory protein n=1 Tax=Tolypocladium ophioglossoides (strain CBS 100239) TaxID=1163406 RepID=A0A0L0MXV2_TOLOC|nr:putative transcriptional regulatory protein [Tolypocladium ophioglossoides CBS 100239]